MLTTTILTILVVFALLVRALWRSHVAAARLSSKVEKTKRSRRASTLAAERWATAFDSYEDHDGS